MMDSEHTLHECPADQEETVRLDIAGTIVRCRRWIAVGCVIVGLLLLPLAPQTADKLEVGGATVHQSEAAIVESLMETQFVAPFASNLVLTVTGMPSPEEVAGIDVLYDIVESIQDIPSVTGVLSYLDPVDPVFLSEHGTFLVVGIAVDNRRMDEVVLELRRATQSLQTQLRSTHPMIELALTGAGALDYDLRLTSAEDATEAEQRVLPVTLILLFVVFGSAVAALCPVVVGGLGVALSLGAAVLISPYWPMTILLQNIVTMIGLGIGIDYCLLMVSRFREEMFMNPDPERAAARRCLFGFSCDNAPARATDLVRSKGGGGQVVASASSIKASAAMAGMGSLGDCTPFARTAGLRSAAGIACIAVPAYQYGYSVRHLVARAHGIDAGCHCITTDGQKRPRPGNPRSRRIPGGPGRRFRTRLAGNFSVDRTFRK